MPIRIGAPPENSFDNPLGLLSDCHRRIERFLDQLILVTEQAQGQTLSEEQRNALETALRYFEKAAPLHTRDEEESLFPRMRAAENGDIKAAMAALDALEADHRKAEQAHATADYLGKRWLCSGSITPAETKCLLHTLQGLRETYRGHIAIEDNDVFPLAGQLLESGALNRVGREMAARRGLDIDHLPAVSRCALRRQELLSKGAA